MHSPSIRVMVVDDSTVLRGLMRKIVEKDPEFEVVTSAANGELALKELQANEIDVVLLDIEMPVMNGMEALPKIIASHPGVAVIMTSTLTLKGAEVTLRALDLGAADFVPKPSTGRASTRVEQMAADLTQKIRYHGRRAASRRPRSSSAAPIAKPASPAPGTAAATSPTSDSFTLRPAPRMTLPPQILAVGSSTGGPNALEALFKGLRAPIPVPVVVTQHMPAMFTTILAKRLDSSTDHRCVEAEDGMALEAGRIHIAPGDHHLLIENSASGPVCRLDQSPPVHFCRPAVDVMFGTLPAVFGERIVATVLTGMGEDGKTGCVGIAERGGYVIAQDQATSVVWGMPGAVARSGVANEVLPLPEIADAIQRRVTSGVRA